VFNLVHGRGPEAGAALASHPKVDLMSFTGSTRGGISVAINAAPTVKRVTQELGGKSPHIVLDDADLEQVAREGVAACYVNSGQSCNALTRMLVPAVRAEEAGRLAAEQAATFKTGDPRDPETKLGPVVSGAQFERVQGLIQTGIKEGAQLLCGGLGRPEGLERGWYVRPTVFGGVDNDMAIARTEIFGPVLSIIPYDDEEQAVKIANDTEYGLAAAISSSDPERAKKLAGRLRAGQVRINNASTPPGTPFGGYKQSGNGREQGPMGMHDYLETKAIIGFSA
jgi:aldehyde dehydrogenase (NAD+)